MSDIPLFENGVGVKMPWGALLVPGARVAAYVRSTGVQAGDDPIVAKNLKLTLEAALPLCRANMGDIVFVLPGHTGPVGTTLMSGAKAGTRIIGVGYNDVDNAPTLTWTAATSNVACSVKNISFENLNFVAAADNITKAFTVTAAGVKFINCNVNCGVSASLDMAIVFSIEAGATNCTIHDVKARAPLGVSQIVNCSAAVAGLTIENCDFRAATAAVGTGLIHVSAAATDLVISSNKVANTLANSTAAITFADVAMTGYVSDNKVLTLADAATPAAGGIVAAGSTNILLRYFNNYHSDGVKNSSGILCPAVTA